MELNDGQANALDKVLTAVDQGQSPIVLTGAAGTGKTTLMKAIKDSVFDITVCTPTNKAAQVLNSKGIAASTFFSKFYILEEGDRKRGVKPKFISVKRFKEEYPHAPLPDGKTDWVDTLAIDEASMLSTWNLREMRQMCNTMILVGDKHQLPPVGDRDNPAGVFSVLEPTAELTEVMRQADGSLILTLATEIRTDGPKVDRMIKHFEPKPQFGELVEQGYQSIAFTNKERQRINHVSRKVLGRKYLWPEPGDLMVSTTNYSDQLINGTLVTVLDFQWDQVSPFAHITVDTGIGRVSTRMDMVSFIEDQIAFTQGELYEHFRRPTDDEKEEAAAELTWAYCLTAHKAQGSEWPGVIVFDQRGLVRKVAMNDGRSAMSPDEYVRRWFYTAVTRARQDLVIAPTWYANAGGGL